MIQRKLSIDRKLRMGMVGGGMGAFIGRIHRMAAGLDNQIELVSGCFSSNRAQSLQAGNELGLPQDRIYGTYRDMMRKEGKMPDDMRLDFVTIVTPNNMHYPISMAALENGFHVMCDRPMTITLDEATNLARKLKQTGKLFCLTHNYTGYPMVKQARELVRAGKIGDIRRIVVEYPQGWLATRLETAGQKQAAWRTDPRKAGPGGCVGDIGSHCANLAEYITGLTPNEVCADLKTFIPGRPLDDDASILLRYDSGARGIIWASQIAIGEENDINIRIYGKKGSLIWHQQDPNTLVVHSLNKATKILRTGMANAFIEETSLDVRLPAGHTEGFLAAFANLYRSFAQDISCVISNTENDTPGDYPSVQDGIHGIRFIEAVVNSATSKDKWVKV